MKRQKMLAKTTKLILKLTLNGERSRMMKMISLGLDSVEKVEKVVKMKWRSPRTISKKMILMMMKMMKSNDC